MEVAVFRCTVCGYNMMYGADQSSAFWLKEFRTIYSSKDKPEITGIGFHQDKGTYTAPTDPDQTWRDIIASDSKLYHWMLQVVEKPARAKMRHALGTTYATQPYGI
ncbi:hypothetical protein BST61_g1385 [Cercospora zeina]